MYDAVLFLLPPGSGGQASCWQGAAPLQGAGEECQGAAGVGAEDRGEGERGSPEGAPGETETAVGESVGPAWVELSVV